MPKLPKPRDLGPVLGADISWPQCPKGMGIPQKRSHGAPMPIDAARYVIIGLTNGPGFYPNPCLAGQTAWVKSRNLMAAAYSVISYPEQRHFDAYRNKGPYDGSTRLGALSNVGYQQAVFNLRHHEARAAPVTDRSGWTSSRCRTSTGPATWRPTPRSSEGPHAATPTPATASAPTPRRPSGSTSSATCVSGIPEWRAAGQTSRAEALRRCGPDRMFQGGDAVLGQWVEADRDMNVTCPGTSREMLRWFHQY